MKKEQNKKTKKNQNNKLKRKYISLSNLPLETYSKIQMDYFAGLSIQELAVKYDLDPEYLNNYIANHGWKALKNQIREQIVKDSIEIFKQNIEAYSNELFGDMLLKWKEVFNNHYEIYKNTKRIQTKFTHVKLMNVAYRSILEAYKVFSGYTNVVNNNNTIIQFRTSQEFNDW